MQEGAKSLFEARGAADFRAAAAAFDGALRLHAGNDQASTLRTSNTELYPEPPRASSAAEPE